MIVNTLLPALMLLSQASAQVNTKSYVTCFTRLNPKPTASVKTTYNVLTLPWYAFKITKSTPSTTITPAASTTTSTTTAISTTTTVLPTVTDTATVISQITSTVVTLADASTTLVTDTASTTFTTRETSTIPAPNGFIPVESSFPGSMKRRAEVERHFAPAPEERAVQNTFHLENGKHVCSPALYPQSVKCVGLVALVSTRTQTKTASSTWTIFAPTPVVTSTVTVTSVTTVTSQPQATTTTTVTEPIVTTSTSTPVVTSTTTVTNAVTVVGPQATFYAACADNNIASTLNGATINSGQQYNNGGASLASAASPYDCCVICLNSPNCGATIFIASASYCFMYNFANTCSQSNRALGVYSVSSSSDEGYVVSNGKCGYINKY